MASLPCMLAGSLGDTNTQRGQRMLCPRLAEPGNAGISRDCKAFVHLLCSTASRAGPGWHGGRRAVHMHGQLQPWGNYRTERQRTQTPLSMSATSNIRNCRGSWTQAQWRSRVA